MEKSDTLAFKDYRDQLFGRLENVVSYASLTPKEQAQYDEDLKWAMDYNETVLYQYDKGVVQGREAEKWEIAKAMKQKNQSLEFIADITGLSLQDLRERL